MSNLINVNVYKNINFVVICQNYENIFACIMYIMENSVSNVTLQFLNKHFLQYSWPIRSTQGKTMHPHQLKNVSVMFNIILEAYRRKTGSYWNFNTLNWTMSVRGTAWNNFYFNIKAGITLSSTIIWIYFNCRGCHFSDQVYFIIQNILPRSQRSAQ